MTVGPGHGVVVSGLDMLLSEHRTSRAGNLERDLPFTWKSALMAAFSYALLLTDVLRTGVAIRGSPYPVLEPSRIVSFGPYAYSVVHIHRNDTVGGAAQDVWGYKYDTTSIGMRAVAEHLDAVHWPPCVFYKTECETRTLRRSTIFGMIDALIAAMVQRKSTSTLPSLTLRTKCKWLDRVHHFVLPWLYDSHYVRTNQAIYYDADTLSAPDFRFCSTSRVQPYACLDSWTHFTTICHASNPLCQGIGHVFAHAAERHRSLQQQYVGRTLDLVVIESQDDHSKASPSYHGRKSYDLVFLTRVRSCRDGSSTVDGSSKSGVSNTDDTSDSTSGACITVAVDDFRYEAVTLTSSTDDSFYVVASLRCLGQMYMWLRIALLVVGCYCARAAEPKFADTSLVQRLLVTLRTVLVIPSQVVVYGSAFPIACYVAAHVLDSAFAYELVSQKFNSSLGVFKLDPEEFVYLGAVSMRSVWVLALVLHMVLYVRTRRQWSPARGISGVAEFSISFVASLTILAQFRSIYFRDTSMLSIAEVVPSARVAMIRAYSYDNALSLWGLILRGNTLDAKCLVASTAALAVVFVVAWSYLNVLNRLHATKRFVLFAVPRSRVSYAANTLWSANALVVSWNGLGLRTTGTSSQTAIVRQFERLRRTKSAALPSKRKSFFWQRVARVSPAQMQSAGRQLRHEFVQLDERSNEVESIVYLMNLTMLTDPVAFMWLRWLCDTRVCVLRSRASQRLFLVPQEAVTSPHNVAVTWSDFELLMTVRATELAWQDLLHCG